MAPVSSKRRKTLPPLAERLVEMQKHIERLSGDPEELRKGLQHVLDSDATWPFDKADLLHWAKALDILDALLAKEDTPEELLIVVLKFSRLLLDNCSNRHVYNSYEHLKRILEHDSCEVVMAVLRVLSVLATPRSTRQAVCEPPFIAKLSALSSIFSSAANGPLSLAACCKDVPEEHVMANGTSVRVQFYRTAEDADADKSAGAVAAKEGAQVVTLFNVHQLPGTDKEVYNNVIRENHVPKDSQFSLRSKLRLARSFSNKERRLQWVRVQVMATTVLAQCQAAYNGVPSGQMPVNEAQLAELIGLLHCEGSEGSEVSHPLDLQTLALKALTALLSERSRHTQSLLSSTAATHQGILSALMRKAKVLVSDCSGPNFADRLKFGEALLAFTWMFASSSTGSNALNTAGIMHFILPILQDCDARRGRFTTLAVKTLEVMMNYSPEMQQTFRDMDGLNILVDRAYAEVCALLPDAACNSDMDIDGKPVPGGEDKMEEVKSSDDAISMDLVHPQHNYPTTLPQDVSADAVYRPFIAKSDKVDEEFERCKLLGQLMHLMASAGTPIATSGDVRELMQPKKKLPHLLRKIFVECERVGASVFEKAAALLTEFVHQEPSCLQHVIQDGVAAAVLTAISTNLPISRGTVTIVPTVIGALCLSTPGSDVVKEKEPIAKFLGSLASEHVVPLLVGDTPSQLGGQLEELMRHNPSLLNPCIEGCVKIATSIFEISEQLASVQEETMQDIGSSSLTNPKTAADGTPAQRTTQGGSSGISSSTDKLLPAQAYLLSAIEFLGKLLDPLMSVAEHSKSFVRNHDGFAAIMKLINRPEIPRDFTSTDAGKFIVLVVGKTAFHSSSARVPGAVAGAHQSDVLGQVMTRTQDLLDSTRVAYEAMLPGDGAQGNPTVNEVELRSLELHLALLSGIVGCLRGSTTATEWDDEKGKKLIDSMAKCYCLLRAAAFSSTSAQPSSGTAATADVSGGESAAVEGGASTNAAGANANSNAGANRDWIAGHGWNDLAVDGILDGLDLPVGSGGAVDQPVKADMRADVAGAIATLLIRLSSSVGSPARRRHDDHNVPSQTHEKALATALTSSFKHLLIFDMIPENDMGTLSRAVNGALVTVSLCFFGSQASVPLLVGDARPNVRGGVNMLLLQAFGKSDGVDNVTRLISRLITAILNAQLGAREKGPSNLKVQELLSETIMRCFAFCKKLLETPLTTIGRDGRPVPLPEFNSAHFNACLKNKLFTAIEPMWQQATPGACPRAWSPQLAPALLDMCLLLIKPNVAETSAEGAAPPAPANAAPAFTQDPATVASLVEMGFPEARVHVALDVLQSNSVELATEWLFSHADAGADDEESSLAAAIALSMNSAGAPSSAALAAVSESTSTGAEAKQPANEDPTVDANDICSKNAHFITDKALEWGMEILSAGNKVEFAVTDILCWICKSKEEQRNRIIAGLLDAIKSQQAICTTGLGCLLRALAILINENVDSCRTACEKDAFKIVTTLLHEKCDKLAREDASKDAAADKEMSSVSDRVCPLKRSARERSDLSPPDDPEAQDKTKESKVLLEAKDLKASENEWVCSSLLILNKVLIHDEQAKIAESVIDPAKRLDDVLSRIGEKRKTARDGEGGAVAVPGVARSSSGTEEPVEAASDASTEQDKDVEYTLLLRFCMRLLHAEVDAQLLHALLDVCARLTRRHDLALVFMQEGGIEQVLTLPESSAFAGQAILTGSLIRHVLEDPISLQASMQNEIRSVLSNVNLRESGRYPTVRSFLGNCANMVQRNPDIFLRAVRASCRVIVGDRGKFVALIDRKEEKGQTSLAEGGVGDSMFMDQTTDKPVSVTDTTARVFESLLSASGKSKNELLLSASGKTKSQTRKGIETMSNVTALLLSKLLSDPRTLQKSAERSESSAIAVPAAASALSAGSAPSSSHANMQTDQQVGVAAVACTVKDTPAALAKLPAILPVNLLRYLTDLVKFFPGCAHFLLKYSIDCAEGGSKGEASKRVGAQEKETFVHFLLRELVPTRGTGSDSLNVEMSRRATSLTLALLSRSNEVRKRIMTEIVSILNAPPKARVTFHLQMLQRLATLLLTFLTAKATSANPNEVSPETVRLFFDAKVPSALCKAIESIDLHHPNASKVGSALMRPLDILCANSSLTDLKPVQSRPVEAQEAADGVPSASAVSSTPGTRDGGGVGGQGGHGDDDDELDADLSLVAPRSGLDDSATPARDSMLMALSMQQDDDDVRVRQDEEMQDQGSVHDDMHDSDDGEESDEDGEDEDGEDGEESGAEIETEGSQQDDDEHDSQMQDNGWEEVIEDGDHDEDHRALLTAGMGDLAVAGFMAPEIDFDGERDLIHQQQHAHLLSRQDLDSMFELMESDVQMTEDHMDIMDRIDMIADVDVRDMRDMSQSHHVLSLLVPGGGGHGGIGGGHRILQNLLPFSGALSLADNMQVIRLPSGRGSSSRGSGVEQRHSPNALHEVPAVQHPLLSRGGANPRARSAVEVARAEIFAGVDRISRRLRQEMEASMIFAHAAGGREWHQALLPPGFGRDAAFGDGSANRWSDDGGASSSSMRTVAQQMEDRLVSMLIAAAPAPVAATSSGAGPATSGAGSRLDGIAQHIEVMRAERERDIARVAAVMEDMEALGDFDHIPARRSDDNVAAAGASGSDAPADAPLAAGATGTADAQAMDVDSSSTGAAAEPLIPPLAVPGLGRGREDILSDVGSGPQRFEDLPIPRQEDGLVSSRQISLGGASSSAESSDQVSQSAEANQTGGARQEAATDTTGGAAPAESTDRGAGDAMDEDEDELEAALRMSMDARQVGITADTSPTPLAVAGVSGPQGESAPMSTGGEQAVAAAAAAAPSTAQIGVVEASPVQAGDGIDPAFLAELPDDLRAEVMAQQARQIAVQNLAASTSHAIDPEFLAALPPDIQADVIRQHQREEAAAAAAQQRAEGGGEEANRSEEMDNASFIASLAPDLREEVLITSNEAFLATLPPHLVAEAHLLRERHMQQDMANAGQARYNQHLAHLSRRQPVAVPLPMGSQGGGRANAPALSNVVTKQVIKEGSVPHILRLLFLSQPVVKSLMNKILIHITAHPGTLEAALRFLLSSVLQACGGGEGEPEIFGCLCTGNLSDGSMAVLQAKRALEALCHVAERQPNVGKRLLQEGFLSDGVVRRFFMLQVETDKGKGKQKMEPTALCTPFSLLISLLATDMFSKSTVLQEQVLHVLNCALQPVVKKAEEAVAAGAPADEVKWPESRYPRVAIQDLSWLTSTLASSGNSTKIMERSTNLLKTLSNDPVNLVTCTTHLVSEAKAEAALSRIGLEALVADLVAAKGKDLSSLATLGSHRKHDMRLLRLAKTLRALWPVKDENAAEKEVKGKEGSSQPLADVVCLDDLWELLGRCLSELEKETEKNLPHAGPSASAGTSAAIEQGGMAAGGHAGMVPEGHGGMGGAGAAASHQQPHQQQQLSMSPALQRMQSLVEAFLVIKAPDLVKEQTEHKPMTVPGAAAHRDSMEEDKASGAAAGGLDSPSRLLRKESSALSPGVKDFVAFAEKHRKTLNLYIRQDKALLHSVAYSPLVRFPKLLDFDNKKHYLRSELKKRNANQRHPNIRLNVRRDFVFEDSFHQILPRKPEELKGRLTIVFQGEEGVDAGGLTREWYLTLSKQMLNPDKALFIHSANGLTYQPNPASTIQPDYLKYFKFAGQLVGKALWDEQLLDAHFTQSMYKHMLNQPIEYTDVESIDPEYYRNLGWMLKNDITDILEETFSIVREQFGEMLVIDLKPNGRNCEVTETNKHEYVQLVAEQQMTRGIKEQIDAFKEGFHQLMPPDLISILTCSELELLMCGLPTIDIEDLRANTEYTGYTRDSPQISWFWTVVQSMVQEDLARLLQFVTGTSQVPMEGFKALRGMNGPQKFNIHRCGDKNRLPSSHTCFNQLDLPEYTSEVQLRKNLLSAVREGFEGFGFS